MITGRRGKEYLKSEIKKVQKNPIARKLEKKAVEDQRIKLQQAKDTAQRRKEEAKV